MVTAEMIDYWPPIQQCSRDKPNYKNSRTVNTTAKDATYEIEFRSDPHHELWATKLLVSRSIERLVDHPGKKDVLNARRHEKRYGIS